jgi:hypothetical protein
MAECERVAQELAAAMPRPPAGVQMVAIERLASLVVDARRMRRSGRYKLADMLRLEHAVLLGTTQLGLGAGYDIRAHNSRRSAARAGGSNRALQTFF